MITINEADNYDKASYREHQIEAELSMDKQMILPKTVKVKTKPFTSSNLFKLTPVGMSLIFRRGNITIANYLTEKDYYKNTLYW